MLRERANEEARFEQYVRFVLFVFSGALGINIGGALLATRVIFPVWSQSPGAAVGWDGRVDEAGFFVVVAPIVMLLAVAAAIASWRAAAPARRWIRTASGLYALFFLVTIIYFVPEQIALKAEAGAELSPVDLSDRLDRWVTRNWLRQLLGVLAFGSALHALGLSYRSSRSGAEHRLHETDVPARPRTPA